MAPARATLRHLRQQGGAPAPPTRPAKSRARSGRHSAGPAGGPALPNELGPVSGWPGWVIGAGAMPAPCIPTEDRCRGWPVPHRNPPWGPERRQKYIPPSQHNHPHPHTSSTNLSQWQYELSRSRPDGGTWPTSAQLSASNVDGGCEPCSGRPSLTASSCCESLMSSSNISQVFIMSECSRISW